MGLFDFYYYVHRKGDLIEFGEAIKRLPGDEKPLPPLVHGNDDTYTYKAPILSCNIPTTALTTTFVNSMEFSMFISARGRLTVRHKEQNRTLCDLFVSKLEKDKYVVMNDEPVKSWNYFTAILSVLGVFFGIFLILFAPAFANAAASKLHRFKTYIGPGEIVHVYDVFKTTNELGEVHYAQFPFWLIHPAILDLDHHRHCYTLHMQRDGNLVMYDCNQKAVWASETAGSDCHTFHYVKDTTFALECKTASLSKTFKQFKMEAENIVWKMNEQKCKANICMAFPAWLVGSSRYVGLHAFIKNVDGNMLLMNVDQTILWESKTAGRPCSDFEVISEKHLKLKCKDEDRHGIIVYEKK